MRSGLHQPSFFDQPLRSRHWSRAEAFEFEPELSLASGVSDSVDKERRLRFCISKMFPENTVVRDDILRITVLEDLYILTPIFTEMSKGRCHSKW